MPPAAAPALVCPASSPLVFELHLHTLVMAQPGSTHDSTQRFDVATALADDLAHVLFGNLQPHDGAAPARLRLHLHRLFLAHDALCNELGQRCVISHFSSSVAALASATFSAAVSAPPSAPASPDA